MTPAPFRPWTTLALCLCLAGCAPTAGSAKSEADLQARLQACTASHGYDPDGAGALGPHQLGPGEVAWRECAYRAVEEVMVPRTTLPDAYRDLIAQDRQMTADVAAGRMDRAERQRRLESLIAGIRVREAEVQAEQRRAATQPMDLEAVLKEQERMRSLGNLDRLGGLAR